MVGRKNSKIQGMLLINYFAFGAVKLIICGFLLIFLFWYIPVFYRVQLQKQFEQKTRQAVENAKHQWEKQQRQEISKSCDNAVKRQQEVWANERQEHLSALEKLKHELATVKKEYTITIDRLKREVSEEKNKSQYRFKRRDSRDYATQVSCITLLRKH